MYTYTAGARGQSGGLLRPCPAEQAVREEGGVGGAAPGGEQGEEGRPGQGGQEHRRGRGAQADSQGFQDDNHS